MSIYGFRKLADMPYDKSFEREDGMVELCHATGCEMWDGCEWWNEYEDSLGGLHYGR